MIQVYKAFSQTYQSESARAEAGNLQVLKDLQ